MQVLCFQNYCPDRIHGRSCDVLKVSVTNDHLVFNDNRKINKMYCFPDYVEHRLAEEFVLDT